ncbi:MAG TPA: ABC transporter permease subunit [Gammaproteobacteria bacterium]|nr:ABC transporter permease subunit [Gammaproteobacteria bacterium]
MLGWFDTHTPGDYAALAVQWINHTLGPLLAALSGMIGALIAGLEQGLLWPWNAALAAGLAALAWWIAGWRMGLFSVLAALFLFWCGLWESTMQTVALVAVATAAALFVAIPLGIGAARRDWAESSIRPLLDFMQTMPPFVYLIPAVAFFGLGTVPGAVATVIFASPPAVRLTNLGIRQVPAEVVEAANAFGATPGQLLFKVQFPIALPTILAGVNQTIMLALSMVVIAGMIGAPGLGADVYRSITRLDVALGFNAGIGVVIVAIYLDRLTQALGRRAAAA